MMKTGRYFGYIGVVKFTTLGLNIKIKKGEYFLKFYVICVNYLL